MLSYQQDESENERDGVDGEEEDLGDTENRKQFEYFEEVQSKLSMTLKFEHTLNKFLQFS